MVNLCNRLFVRTNKIPDVYDDKQFERDTKISTLIRVNHMKMCTNIKNIIHSSHYISCVSGCHSHLKLVWCFPFYKGIALY